jgi:hypothetical protein
MLGLGSAGMARELFIVQRPDIVRVWVCIGLLLGPAVLESWWRARNPLPDATPSPTASSSSQSS